MKRKFIAIAAVLTFGIGGAVVANQLADPPANVENIGTKEHPNWVPLTDADGCDGLSDRPCTGYQAFPGATVIEMEYGTKL